MVGAHREGGQLGGDGPVQGCIQVDQRPRSGQLLVSDGREATTGPAGTHVCTFTPFGALLTKSFARDRPLSGALVGVGDRPALEHGRVEAEGGGGQAAELDDAVPDERGVPVPVSPR